MVKNNNYTYKNVNCVLFDIHIYIQFIYVKYINKYLIIYITYSCIYYMNMHIYTYIHIHVCMHCIVYV